MRLIPRNTKVRTSFYKGVTVSDVILGIVGLGLAALAVASNLPYRLFIALGIACLFIPLFIPVGEERIYKCALYLARHIFSRKKYSAKGKDAANIQSIIPYEKIDGNCIVHKNGTVTGIIAIKPIEFRLLGASKQNYLIDGVLTNVLTSVGASQEAAIVKLEKTLDFDRHIQADLNRIVALAEANENGDLTDGEYAARIDVIQDRLALADTLKTEQKVKYSCYYIAVTDRNKTSLMATLSVMRGTLLSGSIEARILKGGQLAEFIALSKKLDVTDELTAPCETSFRLTSTVQDDKQLSHFVITGYPLKVPNAWGEELFDLPNTKVVMKLKPVEKSKALKRIDTAIMELSTQAKGKASKIIDKTTHVETLSALLARLQNDNEVLFDTTFIITAYDEKGKADNKRLIRRKIRELGFTANEMFGRQADAYLTSEFAAYDAVKISRGIQSSSVAACFPFVSNAVDDADGILIGENKLPAFVDFFKHIDTAEVVRCQIDFLTIKPLAHVFFAENFCELQKKRAAAASGIVYLIDFGFAHNGQLRQKFGNFLWGKVFAAAFARIACIHTHQEFIGVAKSVNRIILIVAKFHIADAVEQFDEFFISSCDRRAEFVGIYVNVVKQSLKVFFAIRTLCRAFDSFEYFFERFVQVGVVFRSFAHIDK